MDAGNDVTDRLEQLLAVTEGLFAARTLPEVGRVLVDRGLAPLRPARGALWLVDDERRHLRRVDTAGAAGAAIPLDQDAPLPTAARTGEPVFAGSRADHAARFPAAILADVAPAADVSYAMVPLVGEAAAVGAIELVGDRADAIAAADRTYLRLLARACAIAIERIQLHARAQAARVDADDATRGREEILTVVSHDLRNPLGTILMGASTLLHLAEPAEHADPVRARVRVVAERIQRQSERMARLIDDLVDFVALQAGRLTLVRAPTQPLAVVTGAAEHVAPIAAERGVQLELDAAPGLPAIAIDRDRAVQVIANLVTNALKVTTKHGRVAIGATLGDGGEVVFGVRDTSAGVPPDELPRLFDDASRGTATAYKGARLALALAAGLVALHGGRIWAANEPGGGATFRFTLTPP